MGPLEVMAESDRIDSQKIDLNINEVFSLDNTTSVRYERTFSLSEKNSVSLIHVDCKAFENTVKSVLINVSLNGVESSKIYKDSNEDYYSPYTYTMGSTLTLRIDPITPLYILSNTISIEIMVQTVSYFGSEVGDFLVQNVILETFSPTVVTATSENLSLPLSISQGTWKISPVTILKERRMDSEIFADISEKVRLRFDISLDAADIPLSLTGFIVSAGSNFVESTELSLDHRIYVDVNQGDTLSLSFKFRPSSELSTDIVQLSITVSVTNIPYIGPKNPSGTEQTYEFVNIPISSLELLRITIIIVPLFVFYIRKTTSKSTKKEATAENIS